MNTKESAIRSHTVSTHTEQLVVEPEAKKEDLTMNFFVIGGVINITMILAYFIWAVRAWKRADKRKGR